MAEVSFQKKDPVLLPGRRKNKWLVIGVAGLLVASAVYGVYAKVTTPTETNAAKQIIAVQRGDVTETVSASGTVQAASQIKLNLSNNAGRLTQVLVKVGDHVKQGQVLATVDDTTAKAQLANAQANLAAAQAKLQQVQQGASPQSVAVQQANLDKARVSLESAKAAYQNQQKLAATRTAPNAQLTSAKNVEEQARKQRDAAKANLDTATAQLTSAQSNGVTDLTVLQTAVTQAQLLLQQTELSLQIASDNLKFTEQNSAPQDKSSLDQAKNNLDQAQASYNVAVAQMNQTQAPPDSASVQAALASVEQAKAQLAQQQASLDSLTVKAPVDGVIAQVNGQVGELPANNTPVLVMNAGGSNQLQILAQISQTDIGKIKIGEQTEFITSAFQGKTFKGQVLTIAPEATTQSGVTSYNVQLSVEDAEQLLRPGMSGNVSILIGTHQNVLYVPPTALKTMDGADGVYLAGARKADEASDSNSATSTDKDKSPEAIAERKKQREARQAAGGNANANMQFQKVEIGYFGGDRVEIISGLQEGDKVVLTLDNPDAASAQKSKSLINIGGGGNRKGGN